jgi:pyruvate/2-oxoglutarate/acetoin dehydrogenase E1 component
MVAVASEAAEILSAEGIEVDLIDPRWISPLDTDLIVASVERTGRLVIVHEANVSGGIGAEIAARVAERSLWSLEAPIQRLGIPDSRIPAAPHLQQTLLPNPQTVAEAVRRTRQD